MEEIIKESQIKELEQKHRQGYIQKPVVKGEFDIFEKEQMWPDL